MITIDGKEAGGQILRVALGLAAITGKPLHVINIRGARPEPGLKVQHLEGVLAVGKLCDAKIKGAKLGSRQIEFYPGKLKSQKLKVQISTAGSIGLLFQSLQIASAFTDGVIEIMIDGGGTAGKWAPPLPYVEHVFLPILGKMGYKADIDVIRHGFYPKGGAKVIIMVHPVKKLRSIQLVERGEVKSIKGISLVGSLPMHIARRQAEAAKQKLKRAGFEAEIEVKVVDTLSPGTCIVLWAETEHSILGADALGERGLPAERVGRGAAKDLLNSINSGAALDLHMADQILPFLSLANSYSTVSVEKITYHCLTNMQVIEKLLPVRFEVKGEKGAKGQISIKGINFENELLA